MSNTPQERANEGNTADDTLPVIGVGKKDMTPHIFRVRKIAYILQQKQKR